MGRANLGHHEADDLDGCLNDSGAESDRLKSCREPVKRVLDADQVINSGGSGTVKPNYEIGERDFLD